MALAPGTPAPDFELSIQPGEAPLRLSDYRGEKPVVLLFFPLAFSSVCTAEMKQIVGGYDRWNALGAEVIGISVDSVYVTRLFANECGAAFPIVSDFNKEAVTAYDVRNDDFFGMKGVANRSAFVVDRRGVVAYAWESEDPDVLPPLEEIEAAIKTSL